MRPHDLVAAAPHRVNAGRVEGAAVPFARVVAKPFEHPFVSPVGAGHETVEGHHHLEDYFSIAHAGRDLPARIDSSRSQTNPRGRRCRTRPATCQSRSTVSSLGPNRAARSHSASVGASFMAGISVTSGPTTPTRRRPAGSCARV